jgi:peptide/nickel transport system ATP-binding protein
VVERAPAEALFERPEHPYTVGLLGSLPRLDRQADELAAIQGMVPDMSALPGGCRFAPRCPFADQRCHRERPPVVRLEGNRWSRCFYAPLERFL